MLLEATKGWATECQVVKVVARMGATGVLCIEMGGVVGKGVGGWGRALPKGVVCGGPQAGWYGSAWHVCWGEYRVVFVLSHPCFSILS